MSEQNDKLPLKIDNTANNRLFVPPSYYRKWVRARSIPHQVAFGSKTASCQFLEHPEQKEEWLLSKDLCALLSIPYETSIHVFQKEHMLHLGPIVGIFTAGFTDHPHRPVGERSLLFAKYLSLSEEIGGYFCLFGAHHIDWKTGTINGIFHTDQGWEKHVIPLPHVVYDRLPNRKTEKRTSSRKVKNRLQKQYLIPWFNTGFFDKRYIYDVLKQVPEVQHHLPETILNPSLNDLKELLNKYRHIYLKPANGSLGLGVHQVTKLNDDPYYYCRFRQNETNRLRRFNDLEQLVDQQFTTKRLPTMVAQQGINLIKAGERPLDFRIHTNKDGNGKWQITAIAAKISGRNSVTTHLKSGGSVKTVSEVISQDDSLQHTFKQLPETVRTISKALDRETEGFIGEIGFDMGIDRDGEIWMFEANSKPGRSIFKHPDLKDEDIATRKLPLEYAVYLAKTSLLKPGLVLV